MAHITVVGKEFNSTSFKTPNYKEIVHVPSAYIKDETQPQPILMDEYGQTPDHYYLARKPPVAFFQVRRKLNLESVKSIESDEPKGCNSKQIKKQKSGTKKVVAKQRDDTSLGMLTRKFYQLFLDSKEHVINLNTASRKLEVAKRRLYDVTNVLEGAGLAEKTSRNNIKLIGKPEPSGRIQELEEAIEKLETKENQLDELIYSMVEENKKLLESNHKYLFLSTDDLTQVLGDSENKFIVGVATSASSVVEANDESVKITDESSETTAFILDKNFNFASLNEGIATEAKTEHGLIDKEPDELETKNQPLDGLNVDAPNDILSYICPWREGDVIIKNAFISEQEDIAPLSLMQTEDQNIDLENDCCENYSFSLDVGEGLLDLFDNSSLGTL